MNPYLWKYPSISDFQISVSGLSAHTPGIASITLGVCANGPWCQRLLKNNSKAVILGKEWLTVWQRQRRHKREGRRKKTEGQKEEEWEEKKEQRGEERGRMTGNNFSLEERLHIEKLLSNNTGYIRARTHTHKLPFPYLSSLCTVLHVLWQKFKPFACRLTDSSHFLVSFPLEFSSNLRPACSLTGINEPSERNATAEETNLMKMAAEIPEERLWKCVFIMKSFRLHKFEVKFG